MASKLAPAALRRSRGSPFARHLGRRPFAVLSSRWVRPSEEVPSQRPRVVVLLHGILGSKSNWATPARRILDTAAPLGWKVLLLDHRGHGLSPGGEAPHDLKACARDVLDTLLAEGVPVEEADIVMCGHSFGGKVALTFTRDRLEAGKPPPKATWIFDSPPGLSRRRDEATTEEDQSNNPGLLLPVLESEVAAGATYADRNSLIDTLVSKYGVLQPSAQWVGQTVRKVPGDRIEFSYDLPVVRSIYDSYVNTDMWDVLEDGRAQIGVVVAGKNRRAWGEEALARLNRVGRHVRVAILEGAGHNVHVDDRPGLLGLLEASWQ